MSEGEKEEGRGEKEANPLSFLLSLLASCLLLAACKPKRPAAERKDKDDDRPPVTAVATGAGHTLIYQSADPKSPPSFSLAWARSDFDLGKGGLDKGHMVLPKGQIYQGGRPTTDYRAETGDADAPARRLDMRTGVVFRSLDGKGTLRADRGQYRGDVKLVRAIGGVVAAGPFGTLSGAPELWATPDFHTVGTPAMVAQKLKLPALAALAATAATGTARVQKGLDYAFENRGGTIADVNPDGSYTITATPRPGGPLVLTLRSRNMVVRSAGTVVILTDKAHTQVVRMTSEGAVGVVQTTPAGRTTMDGTGSVYESPLGSATATLDVGGRVTLVSVAKGASGATSATTSKGDKGRAILLDKPPAGGSGLRSATLTGNVTIDSTDAGDGAFRGTGDRLVYTPRTGTTADADLTGHVVLTSVKTGKDADGKATTNTTVGRGAHAVALIDSSAAAGQSPLRNAVLDQDVAIDVTGSNAQTFKGTGDKVVYTSAGLGGNAVMTGDLKFYGDTADLFGDLTGSDTATVRIGKSGLQRVELSNSTGASTRTNLGGKDAPTASRPAPTKKGRKGGRP